MDSLYNLWYKTLKCIWRNLKKFIIIKNYKRLYLALCDLFDKADVTKDGTISIQVNKTYSFLIYLWLLKSIKQCVQPRPHFTHPHNNSRLYEADTSYNSLFNWMDWISKYLAIMFYCENNSKWGLRSWSLCFMLGWQLYYFVYK